MPEPDGVCALRLAGGPEEIDADLASLELTQAWIRKQLSDPDVPEDVKLGLHLFPFNRIQAAPLAFSPEAFTDLAFVSELEGRPFAAWEPLLLSAEEGLRRFGIDESSIFRVTDAFMTLCSAKTLAAMLARRKAGSMRG